MTSIESYVPRPVRFVERVACDGWRPKVYALATTGDRDTDGLVAFDACLNRVFDRR